MTTLLELFGIRVPVIQAPMAGVQLHALAAAVSNAGGLGSLPCAMLTIQSLNAELAALRSATDQPFNVNFFCHEIPNPDPMRETAWRAALRPFYDELGVDPASSGAGSNRTPFSAEAADVLEAVKPAVVSFHFGLPSAELLSRVRSWGSKIVACATTVEEGRWLDERGVDAIIAQGLEAGGHRGTFLREDSTTQMGTFALLPQMVRAVKAPVIAAGGIADARGVAAAMALGAAGVQVGTSYLLCPEATTTEPHKRALQAPVGADTAITNLFSGKPARGIVNRLMRELGPMSLLPPAFPLAAAAIAPLRSKAESSGRGDFSPLWAGQNALGCKPVPAGQLTRELASRV